LLQGDAAMPTFSQVISFMMQILPFVNILFAATVIFSERRNPAVTWAWLMVIFLVPYFGFIFYLIIGIEGRKYRTFASKYRQNLEWLKEVGSKNLAGLSFMRPPDNNEHIANFKENRATKHISDLLHLNFVSGGGYLTQNNQVDILTDGEAKFSRLFQDIENAESFIHIQYYIFRNDDLGRKIVAALAKKAAQGVEVCLLLDGMGNFTTPKRVFKPLIAAGGRLGIFLPPHFFFRGNFQNHRKICVIDGKIGYIGGFNIGDEYMGKVVRFGPWRDLHIRIRGNAAKELGLYFIMDWNFISPKNPIEACGKYFPVIDETAEGEGCLVQIVSGGPDTKWPNIYNGLSKMIYEANQRIYIQTPYFVPDENIFESLKIAALSGIDVRIVIPANPDHPFVKWCSMSYLGELLKAGVKCFEYTEGFIHSKMMIIDDIVTSVGTTNMDMRSFKLNFEINAFIYDYKQTDLFREQFYRDLKDSVEITEEAYQNRSWWQKVKEAFSRLLSPLL
jgi:cardiolipin synthase